MTAQGSATVNAELSKLVQVRIDLSFFSSRRGSNGAVYACIMRLSVPDRDWMGVECRWPWRPGSLVSPT